MVQKLPDTETVPSSVAALCGGNECRDYRCYGGRDPSELLQVEGKDKLFERST